MKRKISDEQFSSFFFFTFSHSVRTDGMVIFDVALPRDNRHRRLDREAALLTREAEADAHRWGDNSDSTLSSSAPRSPSSSPSRHHAATTTVSYSSSSHYGDTSSGTPRSSSSSSNREAGRSTQDSTSDLTHAAPVSSRSGNVGGPSWRYRRRAGVAAEAAARETSLGVGGAGGGDAASAGTGTGTHAAAFSWDRELASTLAREGPAAPGWPSRWRPGVVPGSRAALGLWERAGGLDRDDDEGDGDEGGSRGRANDEGVSPPDDVDTAQEVSEG